MSDDDTSGRFQTFEVELREGATIARMRSKLVTEERIQEFGDEIYRIAEDPALSTLILDFSQTQYLSSAATGKLINTKKKVGKHRRLILCGFHPDLREVFRITRLDQVFSIAPTLELALASLAGTTLVSCPMPDCDGWARASTQSAGVSDIFQCPSCFARYDGHPGVPDGTGVPPIAVSWIQFETYEKEWIRLYPGHDQIEVYGRLDLFVMGTVERALRALPAPRAVLFNLYYASDVTRAGVDAVSEWFTRHDDDSAIFLVANPSPVREAVGPSFVYTDDEQAMEAHAARRQGRRVPWSPTVVFRHEGPHQAADAPGASG
jgi:anti-sigma B factor antagonist